MTWHDDNRQWLEKAREHWSARSPEPLRVRCWFAAPVSWDCYDPLMLEGALQYSVIQLETGRAPDDVFANCPLTTPLEETDAAVPIADCQLPGCSAPIAMASCAWFSPDATPTVRWRRRRLRAEQYARDTVKASQGDTKACNMPAATVTALYADWYVCGDRARILALLPDVSHVGGKRGGGLGLAQGWEVEPTEHRWWFSGPGGRLMRALPATDEVPPQSDLREGTLRVPYWHPRTRCLCAVPAQRLGEVLA